MYSQFTSLYARATQLAIDTNIKLSTNNLYFDNNPNSSDNAQIPQSTTNRLKDLANLGVKNHANLNQLVTIFEKGGMFPVTIHQQVNSLLQQNNNNYKKLDDNIAKLLSSLVQRDNREPTIYKQVSHALLEKWHDVTKQNNRPLIQQSMVLLKQISQGITPDLIKDKVKQILISFKENSSSLQNQQVGKDLKVLLQKLLKESHSPNSSQSDMQLAKDLAELMLRLNQQISESEQLTSEQLYLIQQQQEQQQNAKEEHTDEEEMLDAVEETEIGLMLNRISGHISEPQIPLAQIKSKALSGLELYKGDNLFSSGLAILFAFMDMLSTQSNGRFFDMEKNSEIAREAQKLASAVDGVLANVAAQGKSSANGPLPADVIKYIEDNHLVISGVTLFANDLDGGRWTWHSSRTQLIYSPNFGGLSDQSGVVKDIAQKNNIKEFELNIAIYMANSNAGNNNDYHWETNFRSELKKFYPNLPDEDINRLFTSKGLPNYNQGDLTAIKGALDNKANSASDFISTSQLQLQKLMQTYNVCVSLINSMQTMLSDMNKMISQGFK
ncbi:hypothetical protein ACAX46_004258 [Providencia rettgeri]